MPYTKQDLQNLYSLSFEDVDATLAACGLSKEQDEYADEQIQSGFDVIRKYFNEAQVSDFAAAAEMFNQQSSAESKSKKTGRGKKASNSSDRESSAAIVEANDLDISQLLAQATSECGTRISLTEAGKILDACGLPDKPEYTGVECDRFVEACALVKQQGKTYQEVAAYFGVAQDTDESLEHQELLAEVQEMQSSVSSLSSTQAARVMQALPQMSLEQLRAIKLQFLRDLNRELRQYIDSGQMQAEFEAAAKTVTKQPLFDWSLNREAERNQLNGDRPHKSLPGS